MGSSKWESNFYIALGMFSLSKKPLFLLDYRRHTPVGRTLEKFIVNYEPNDRNKPTQHVATLLGAICCVRLATLLRCVATCWVLLAQLWKWSNLSQQHLSQHVVTRWQNARDILRPTMLRSMLHWLFFLVLPEPSASAK